MSRRATVFVPGSIGNVGPGFDVLGLAVSGAGDRVSVALREEGESTVRVTGRDADRLPSDVALNSASVAALHYLRGRGWSGGAEVLVEKGLPLSGGMGGSAASSVGGAAAAAYALGEPFTKEDLLEASLAGESVVAGRHLDNIAASLYGGLTLSLSVDPPIAVKIPIAKAWWLTLVTPAIRIETRYARSILPATYDRATVVQQMANVAALVRAFETGDEPLLSRALVDHLAEPYRAMLIPCFVTVKEAALRAGAFGCTISGAGPTVFAISGSEWSATEIAVAMQEAFGATASTIHVGAISTEGVARV